MPATTTPILYTMSDAPSVIKKMNLQQFAESEFRGEPLFERTTIRYTKRLSSFLKTVALTENVGESTVIRHALEFWAATQGFETHRGD